MLTIETVAVLGAGEAGTACAVLAALAGCRVRLQDPDAARVAAACEALRQRVELGIAQGAFTPTERQRILDGVLFTCELDEALTGADLAIHAATSGPPPAAALAQALRATALIATAGAAEPAALAATLPQPGRVLVLRLSPSGGPVPRLDVDAAPATTGHVLERARAFASRVNRAARLVSRSLP